MSGEFPTHQRLPVGTTTQNLPEWGPMRQSAAGASSGSIQVYTPPTYEGYNHGAAHNAVSHSSHLPSSLSQLQGYTSWPGKVSSSVQNGSSGTSSLTGAANSSYNFQMIGNQEPNCTPVASVGTATSISSNIHPSVNMSNASRTIGAGQSNKESLDVRNGAITSSAVSFNGDVLLQAPSTVMSTPPRTPQASSLVVGNNKNSVTSGVGEVGPKAASNVSMVDGRMQNNASSSSDFHSSSSVPLKQEQNTSNDFQTHSTKGQSHFPQSETKVGSTNLETVTIKSEVSSPEQNMRSPVRSLGTPALSKTTTTPKQEIQKSSQVSTSACTPVSVGLKQEALDVESQLEAMFAGIDGSENKDSLGSPSTKASAQPSNVTAVLESKPIKKSAKPAALDSAIASSSTETTQKKTKQKKRPNRDKDWQEGQSKKSKKSSGGKKKSKSAKESSLQTCDTGSSATSSRIRGPVVRFEGPKEAPTRSIVVNGPIRVDDEENDNKRNSSKPRKGAQKEGKINKSGVCTNSLIARFENQTPDAPWVCVFCKLGPHMYGTGDLFGPYLLGQDDGGQNSEIGTDRKDKKDKKAKRPNTSGTANALGLLAIPVLENEAQEYIIWAHEDCLVWSPGVYLIGTKLAGLHEAVLLAVQTKCERCLVDGANIGCTWHGCKQRVHYRCALDNEWILDEDSFHSFCKKHRANLPSKVVTEDI